MNGTATITLEDIREHYENGALLIGFVSKDGKQQIKVYHKESQPLQYMNMLSDESGTTIYIDKSTQFCLKCITTTDKEHILVGKVIWEDSTKKKLYMYVDGSMSQKSEDKAVDIMLLARMLCALSNKTIRLGIDRYYNPSDCIINNIPTVVIGKTEKNMPKPSNPEIAKVLYISEKNKHDFKWLVKQLKNLLNIDKKISYLRVYQAYNEFRRGRLYNSEFSLWGVVYNKFYKLDPANIVLYQLETMSKDENTKVIVSYLVSRYRTKLYESKKLPIPLEVLKFHPDVNIEGNVEKKIDTYFTKIKQNYLTSMFCMHTQGETAYPYILDIGCVLSPADMKKFVTIGICVIQFIKVGKKMKIVVNLSSMYKSALVEGFKATPIIENLTRWFKLKQIITEFNSI